MRDVVIQNSKTKLFLAKPAKGKAFWTVRDRATVFKLDDTDAKANEHTDLWFALALCKNSEIVVLPPVTQYEEN